MSIGDRLKKERKRLGYSQAEFAEKLGVHRNSQSRYEAEEREPETSYLNALGKIGVDVSYVMTGVGEEEGDLYNETINRLFVILCGRVGINHDRMNELISEAFDIEKSTLNLKHGHAAAAKRIDDLIARILFERIVDFDLVDLSVLTAIFEEMETVMEKNSLTITPAKKASAAIMLYRAFKANGTVDLKMIEETVNLASSSATP